jgi:hypothetical protein
MLHVQLFLEGSEYYFKAVDEDEDVSPYESENLDYSELEEDSSEPIGHIDQSVGIEVSLNDENVLSESHKIIGKDLDIEIEFSPIDEDWHGIADADEDDSLVIWGHSGLVFVSLNFNEVKNFDQNKLKFIAHKTPRLGTDDTFDRYMSLTYDDKFADEEEVEFVPKHGYWGAEIISSE